MIRTKFYKASRPFYLLALCLIIVVNGYCESLGKYAFLNADADTIQPDSLYITINMPPKSSTGFNYSNHLLQTDYVGFDNKEPKSATITKFIKVTNKNQVIFNVLGKMINGKFEAEYQVFLFAKGVKQVVFSLGEGKKLTTQNNSVYNISKFIDTYETFKKKAYLAKSIAVKEEVREKLSMAFRQYDSLYKNSTGWQYKCLQKLNQYYYYGLTVMLNEESSIAKEFITGITDPVIGRGLMFLLFNNAKYINEYNKFNNEPPNEQKYLAMGVMLYLENGDNKVRQNYESAKKWFFSSAWYKANKEAIDKTFATVSNIEFKNYVKKLSFTNTKGQALTMRQIIKQHPSPYYLLDFWATWCKPCIEGAKIIKEKGVPPKVKVLSLSLDRPNRKEKWKEMTQELQQDYTYWVKVDANLKAFVDALKLQAIPRYILVDREFNIVDNAFYAPYEPKFLSTLEKL